MRIIEGQGRLAPKMTESVVQYRNFRRLVSDCLHMKRQGHGSGDTHGGDKNQEDIRLAMSVMIASVHAPPPYDVFQREWWQAWTISGVKTLQ